MSDRRYRFCYVTGDGKRTGAWTIERSASKREVYVERERPGRVSHVSLHESGQWHLKVLRPQRGGFAWDEPAVIAPGHAALSSVGSGTVCDLPQAGSATHGLPAHTLHLGETTDT